MAGLGNSRPKTQAQNSAAICAILLQLETFQNLGNDPQFFQPWKQECLEKEEKLSHESENSCPSFGTRFPKNGHSVSVSAFNSSKGRKVSTTNIFFLLFPLIANDFWGHSKQ